MTEQSCANCKHYKKPEKNKWPEIGCCILTGVAFSTPENGICNKWTKYA